MKEINLIVNFDDQRRKREMLARMGALKGEYEITLKRYHPRRSNRANAYWWSCIIGAFQEYNREQGDEYTPEECHLILKRALLPPVKFVNRTTGELVEIPAESHTMDKQAFGNLIERAIAYLAEMGVVVPDPYELGGLQRREKIVIKDRPLCEAR